MTTKELLIRYRDLFLADKEKAQEFRTKQTDSLFIHLLEMQDRIKPLFLDAMVKRRSSVSMALSETPEIKPAMMASVMEDVAAEVKEKLLTYYPAKETDFIVAGMTTDVAKIAEDLHGKH